MAAAMVRSALERESNLAGAELLRARAGGRTEPLLPGMAPRLPLTTTERRAAIAAAVAKLQPSLMPTLNLRWCGLTDDDVACLCGELLRVTLEHPDAAISLLLCSNPAVTEQGCEPLLTLFQGLPALVEVEVNDEASALMRAKLVAAGARNREARDTRRDAAHRAAEVAADAALAVPSWRWAEPTPIFYYGNPSSQLEGCHPRVNMSVLPNRRSSSSAMTAANIKALLKAHVPGAKVSGTRDELFDRLKLAKPGLVSEPYALSKHKSSHCNEDLVYAAVRRLLLQAPLYGGGGTPPGPRRSDWAACVCDEYEAAIQLEYCVDKVLPPTVCTGNGRRLVLNYARCLAEDVEVAGAFGHPDGWDCEAKMPPALLWYRRAERAFEAMRDSQTQLKIRLEYAIIVEAHAVAAGGAAGAAAKGVASAEEVPVALPSTQAHAEVATGAAAAAAASASSQTQVSPAPPKVTQAALVSPSPLTGASSNASGKKRTIADFFQR